MKNSYVIVLISGKNISLFIRKLLLSNISYSKLKKINNNKIILTLNYENYLLLEKIKSIYDINVIGYKGYLKYYLLLKKYSYFIINFFISIIFLIVLSNICFDINVIHNDKDLRKLVLEELNDNNIKKYFFIPSFQKRKLIIEKIISNNKNNIEWMEIERKGVKLIVKLTERKERKKENLDNIRDIIAKKDGIIKKIEAQEGVVLKEENDFVKKGDVIITGNIIKDDVVKKQVSSKGRVYAEVWYHSFISYPLYYNEIKYLDEVKNKINISFFDKTILLSKNYDNTKLQHSFIIVKDKFLPFKISINNVRKIKIINEKLTVQKALNKAIKIAEDKLNKKLSKDEYIIDKKTLKFNRYSSKIEIDVFFKVYENITDYKNIDKLQN